RGHDRGTLARDYQIPAKVEQIVLSILRPKDQLRLGQSLNDTWRNEGMSPFWNVIHDKRQFTFPGNCLEVVEEPGLTSRVIVRGSCDDCVCAGILSVLRES